MIGARPFTREDDGLRDYMLFEGISWYRRQWIYRFVDSWHSYWG
jgi:hypothetical protein